MKSYRKGYRRFLTYALVGCFDTAMDWLAFTLMHALLLATPELSQTVGYLVGGVCSFMLNGRVTFGDGEGCKSEKLVRFVLWNAASLAVSAVLISALTHWGMSAYYAKIIVTLEVALVNYIGYKYIVFHVKRINRRDRA